MDFINSIKDLDTQLFLFLNSKHNSFFDFLMYWASNKYTWVPLYLFFGYLSFKHFGKKLWLIVLATFLLILLSDQISNHAFKNTFLRFRPCHNLLIMNKVHLNGDCGGTYGFVSSHAANTFALAMFLSLLFYKQIKHFGLFVFFWATFVSFSRIYNGNHYPADVVVGGLMGMCIGIIVFIWYKNIEKKIIPQK